jgi:hypothetical protein
MVETLTRATKSQDTEKTQDKKRKLESAPLSMKALADESVPFSGLLGISAMELPLESHAASLGDPHFSHPANNAQKARMVTELQGTYGNQYVQRLAESLNVQAKLTVSSSNDEKEMQKAMRMSIMQVRRLPAVPLLRAPFGRIQAMQRRLPRERIPYLPGPPTTTVRFDFHWPVEYCRRCLHSQITIAKTCLAKYLSLLRGVTLVDKPKLTHYCQLRNQHVYSFDVTCRDRSGQKKRNFGVILYYVHLKTGGELWWTALVVGPYPVDAKVEIRCVLP